MKALTETGSFWNANGNWVLRDVKVFAAVAESWEVKSKTEQSEAAGGGAIPTAPYSLWSSTQVAV